VASAARHLELSVPLPQPIPKRAFQLYALVLLVVAWVGALAIALRGAWPMPLLVPWVGSMLSGVAIWVAASLVWMVLVVPVRLFTSGFETLEEALARTGSRSLGEAIAKERAKTTALGSASDPLRQHLVVAAVAGVLAIALGIGTAVNVELYPARLYLAIPIAACASAAIAIVRLVRALQSFVRRRD
jgi:hypothetical protein